jgi:hypothetical protein
MTIKEIKINDIDYISTDVSLSYFNSKLRSELPSQNNPKIIKINDIEYIQESLFLKLLEKENAEDALKYGSLYFLNTGSKYFIREFNAELEKQLQ